MKGVKKIIMLAVVMLGMLVGLIFSASSVNKAKASAVANNGGSIVVDNNSTFTMDGGSISGSSANKGGAIYIGDGATFTMNGGTIENCTGTYGGAIYVANGGECYLMSGSIENCEGTYGGAVYVEEGGYLYIEEGFIITGCGADYSESLGFVRQQDVNRPVTIYPYNNLQGLSEIKARSNQTLNEVGLPDLTGCSWFKESSYDNRYNLTTYVGANTNYDDMSMYFTGHNFANAGSASDTGCLSFTEECEYGCGSEQTRYYSHDSNRTEYSQTYYSYGSYETVREGTCTEQEYRRRWRDSYDYVYYYCSKCGASRGSSYRDLGGGYVYSYGSKDPSNHTGSQSTTTVTAATCTRTGTSRTTWSCCGKSSTSTIAKDPSNHTGSQSTTTVTAATCTSTGTSRTTWSCCGKSSTSTIAKDPDNHTGSQSTTTVTAATCISVGTSRTTWSCCGTTRTLTVGIDPTNHLGSESLYSRSEATCTAAASTTYRWSCCGTTRTVTTGSALGHVTPGRCSKATGMSTAKCSRCGGTVRGRFHKWVGSGSIRTCSYCGISAGHLFAPSGGEHSHEEDIEINIERTLQQINTIVDLSNITFESNVNTKVTLVSEKQYYADISQNHNFGKAIVALINKQRNYI